MNQTEQPKDIDGLTITRGGEFTLRAIQNAPEINAKPAPGPDWDAWLEARRFNAAVRPPPAVPIITIGGQTMATAGNIQASQAKVKQGKTGLTSAMIAAAMRPGHEFLGLTCRDSGSRRVLHFDTEQSRQDHDAVMRIALARAELESEPEWLRSHTIADGGFAERREAIFHAMERAHTAAGLYLVILDGVADLVSSPNNEEEAIALIARLHQAAIRYDAAIWCTLHENPGTEIGKTRGHLGSELERKAETNLRLEKGSDGVTVVYTERARHAHIAKGTGPRFAWDDAAGMHMDVATAAASKGDAKRKRYVFTLEQIYRNAEPGGMKWSDLLPAIGKLESVKDGRKKFDEMREMGLLYERGTRWIFKG